MKSTSIEKAYVSKVLILHGEISPEATPDEQDTLVQVSHIRASLAEQGFHVDTLPVGLNLERLLHDLEQLKPDLIWNLAETVGGSMRFTSFIPMLLESKRIPFTGCPAEALFLTTNKCLTKQSLVSAGIPTPRWWGHWITKSHDLIFPSTVIAKSVYEEGSIGLDDSSVRTCNNIQDVSEHLRQRVEAYGGEWFVEEYIAGREFNVSLLEGRLGPEVLPLAEIDFSSLPGSSLQIVGYRAKWDETSPEYAGTLPVFRTSANDTELAEKIRALALHCWTVFGLRGYARVDMRISAEGVPYVIEINANPCISPGAGFIRAAEEKGLGYRDVVMQIMEFAR